MRTASHSGSHLSQLRLLLEEVCCDLCRFEHVVKDGYQPEDVRIEREFYLGAPGAFADIRVEPAGRPPYFVEVKFGHSTDIVIRHLQRKYGPETAARTGASKIIVVADHRAMNWIDIDASFQRPAGSGLALELWDERRLLAMMRELFRTEFETITAENLVDLRQSIDRAKGFIAFGGESIETYEHDPLKAQLLWHFGFWRLRQLRERHGLTPRELCSPGTYHNVAVLLADLCSFSSYVRDTPDAAIMRESLTAFYSKARYQIINNGGMLYQFVGDQVVALFGIPEQDDGFLLKALTTAEALTSIGQSVSNHWQRQIDRVQTAGGLHIGMALGELQMVALRPFSRTHIGAIGDCVNVAARLMSVAGQSETVISNAFYQRLPEQLHGQFSETDPVEARNVGRIKAWKRQ